MSATMGAALRADAVHDVLAVWRVRAGALMVAGRMAAPPPASGVAQAQRAPSARGVFRAQSWVAEEAGGFGFLAAVRLPDDADPAPGSVVALRGADGDTVVLRLAPGFSDAPEFGQLAAQLAGRHAATAMRFLMDTLRPSADQEVPSVSLMMRAFLSQAAQPDGCVEIMVAVTGGCVLLQGWGSRITGQVQVVLAGAALPIFPGYAGEFARTDTAPPATGVMLALPGDAASALRGIDHVFVLSDAGLHSRTLVEHRLLEDAASLGHVRHMLPSLRCPAPMQEMLQEALRPRFAGRDTLAGHAIPVRAAVDVCAAAPGVGVYLSGWVFDPARAVASLQVCGAAGFAARIDGHWTRVPRPDVTEAFRTAAGFPPPPDDAAGFAVFCPAAPQPGEALHLQFTFADGDRAFMPLQPADPAAPGFRPKLLASIDLYKPSGLPVIERHAAPLLARLPDVAPPPAAIVLAGPVERPEAVVVPLAAASLPRALLSSFLHDPAEPCEQLVLVCGPDWGKPMLDALVAMLRFYRLPASVLQAAVDPSPLAALREAARATRATRFLLAGPAIAPSAPGWRQALRVEAGDAAFACPTLLYEDWSIRYAGASATVFLDAAPYVERHAALAGLPAGLAGAGPSVAAAEGMLACCLLPRATLAALDGGATLLTEAGQETAFFLRLRKAGLAGRWVRAVQVYAPEDGVEMAHLRAARLLDGWVLRDAWRGEAA